MKQIVIDKFPPKLKPTITLEVDVKFSRKFRARMAIGMALMRLAVWVMEVGLRVDEVEQ